MNGLRDKYRWVIWALKLPAKAAHQFFCLAISPLQSKYLCDFVFSNWPQGSPFRNSTDYRGLRIAAIAPQYDEILVVNDYLDRNGSVLTTPRFIPFIASRRLGMFRSQLEGSSYEEKPLEAQSPDEREMTMLDKLCHLSTVEPSVILTLSGKVIVTDGVHRLIALYVRDKGLRNVRFYVTL